MPAIKLQTPHGIRVLVIKDRPYMDTIFEFESLFVDSGDSLSIHYDMDWQAVTEVDDEEISRIPWTEAWESTRVFDKRMVIRFSRFTKLGDVCSIEVFEEMPTDIRQPNPEYAAMIVRQTSCRA